MFLPVFACGAVVFHDDDDDVVDATNAKICFYICHNCSSTTSTAPVHRPPSPSANSNNNANLPDVIRQSIGKYQEKTNDADRPTPASTLQEDDNSERSVNIWRQIGKDLCRIADHAERERRRLNPSAAAATVGWRQQWTTTNLIMQNLLIFAIWKACRWFTR